MPILTEDIKLLKSAVMADVPEGGGAMTGIAVIDGQSNNLFPDTSAMDRALGRVNARKLFGAAHTEDTATLMGAHAIITQAPADPLVQCSIIRTANWGDRRVQARDAIEKYLVKGPRIAYGLYDTHYSGSQFINLVAPPSGVPPVGGDALVLINPNGDEQYVRLLKVTTAIRQVAIPSSSGEYSTVLVLASVATCTLTSPLLFDFLGPPPLTFNSSAFARVHSTSIAAGAKFYGIKALANDAAAGAYFVVAAGGIYTPVVPAATVESPVIDQYPIQDRSGLVATGTATLALKGVAVLHAPGTKLTTPSPITPGTLSLTSNTGVFKDDKNGLLMNGTLAVGAVDYKLGSITFSSTSPNYGTYTTVVSYMPATKSELGTFSSYFDVTTVNQGRSYVNVFEPPPAPGSFTLSYMAQGKWYDLSDSLGGKLVGSDPSYGSGTIDYATGSMSVTLGAIPDVLSPILADWGTASSAMQVPASGLPLRLGARLSLPAHASLPIDISWSRDGSNYTAKATTEGLVTGQATGSAGGGVLIFEPDVFPDGPITMNGVRYESKVNTIITPVTNPVAYTYKANTSTLPMGTGTVTGKLAVTLPPSAIYPATVLDVFDRAGRVYARYNGNKEDGIANSGGEVNVGTIDYTSGEIVLFPSSKLFVWFFEDQVPSGTTWVMESYKNKKLVQVTMTIAPFGALTSPSYSSGTTTTYTTTYETVNSSAPVTAAATATTWTALITTQGTPLVMSNLSFKMGGDTYSVAAGVLRKGWDAVTGLPLVASAGTLTSDGKLTVSALPSNFTNGISWSNAAQDVSARLVDGGVFRTSNAPLKQGVFQMQVGGRVASAVDSGTLSGGDFEGTVDFQRGVVKWRVSHLSASVTPAALSYNAVFLQYLPLDVTLLGIDTVRLPLDGKVPVLRQADLMVVHNTLKTQLPNPLVKGTAYNMGRVRIASVRIKDAVGVVVPSGLYVSELNPGLITFPAASTITGYTQPFTVEHRIEDMLVCSQADISGKVTFTRSLTHSFPAATSFVSSAMPFGDLFARAYSYKEQVSWTGAWSDDVIGSAPLANFNEGLYPAIVTNRGAITERWAIIFTSNLAFKVVGESVGDIGNSSTSLTTSPINPATGAPYFTLPLLGWGNGWAAGNVLRFNTAACGVPFWAIRTVLQGPPSVDSDVFSIAFRGDVDRP